MILRIEMYGDSTTYGAQTIAGALRQTEFNEPRLVRDHLSARFPDLDIVVNNNGVGGAQAVELLFGWDGVHPAWQAQMAASAASIVTLNFGLNDSHFHRDPDKDRMAVPPALYGEVIEELVGAARTAGKIVALCEPNPTIYVTSDPTLSSYVEVLRQVARRLEVPLVGHFDAILAREDWLSFLSEDGVHPSDALYAIKAELTARALVPLIEAVVAEA